MNLYHLSSAREVMRNAKMEKKQKRILAIDVERQITGQRIALKKEIHSKDKKLISKVCQEPVKNVVKKVTGHVIVLKFIQIQLLNKEYATDVVKMVTGPENVQEQELLQDSQMRLNQLERPILASDVGLLTILQEIVIKKQWHRLQVIGRIFKMAHHQMPSHLKKNINALNAEKWVILHLNVPLIKNDKIIKELYSKGLRLFI